MQHFSSRAWAVWLHAHGKLLAQIACLFFGLCTCISFLFPVTYVKDSSFDLALDRPFGHIVDGMTIEQLLPCEDKVLHRVGVYMSTYARENRGGVVHLQILDAETKRVLAQRDCSTEEIVDNAFLSIEIAEPQVHHAYLVRISSTGCTEENAVTPWLTKWLPSENTYTQAMVNGAAQSGALNVYWAEEAQRNRGLWEFLLIFGICLTLAPIMPGRGLTLRKKTDGQVEIK